jgi:hypothetical protein
MSNQISNQINNINYQQNKSDIKRSQQSQHENNEYENEQLIE